jgi:hypothetical protein
VILFLARAKFGEELARCNLVLWRRRTTTITTTRAAAVAAAASSVPPFCSWSNV